MLELLLESALRLLALGGIVWLVLKFPDLRVVNNNNASGFFINRSRIAVSLNLWLRTFR